MWDSNLVDKGGLEPPTSCLSGMLSNQLIYLSIKYLQYVNELLFLSTIIYNKHHWNFNTFYNFLWIYMIIWGSYWSRTNNGWLRNNYFAFKLMSQMDGVFIIFLGRLLSPEIHNPDPVGRYPTSCSGRDSNPHGFPPDFESGAYYQFRHQSIKQPIHNCREAVTHPIHIRLWVPTGISKWNRE